MEHSITVSGHARREVTPDVARWTFDVTGTGEDEAAALGACVDRTGAVLVALRDAFGADVVVSTGPTSLHEAYDDEPDFEEPPTARASVTATLPAELAGRAAPIAVDAGASGAHGPQWDLAAAEAVREELLVEAFEVARRKAGRLAEAAGRALGPAVEIRESQEGAFGIDEELGIVPPLGDHATTPAISATVNATFALDRP